MYIPLKQQPFVDQGLPANFSLKFTYERKEVNHHPDRMNDYPGRVGMLDRSYDYKYVVTQFLIYE